MSSYELRQKAALASINAALAKSGTKEKSKAVTAKKSAPKVSSSSSSSVSAALTSADSKRSTPSVSSSSSSSSSSSPLPLASLQEQKRSLIDQYDNRIKELNRLIKGDIGFPSRNKTNQLDNETIIARYGESSKKAMRDWRTKYHVSIKSALKKLDEMEQKLIIPLDGSNDISSAVFSIMNVSDKASFLSELEKSAYTINESILIAAVGVLLIHGNKFEPPMDSLFGDSNLEGRGIKINERIISDMLVLFRNSGNKDYAVWRYLYHLMMHDRMQLDYIRSGVTSGNESEELKFIMRAASGDSEGKLIKNVSFLMVAIGILGWVSPIEVKILPQPLGDPNNIFNLILQPDILINELRKETREFANIMSSIVVIEGDEHSLREAMIKHSNSTAFQAAQLIVDFAQLTSPRFIWLGSDYPSQLIGDAIGYINSISERLRALKSEFNKCLNYIEDRRKGVRAIMNVERTRLGSEVSTLRINVNDSVAIFERGGESKEEKKKRLSLHGTVVSVPEQDLDTEFLDIYREDDIALGKKYSQSIERMGQLSRLGHQLGWYRLDKGSEFEGFIFFFASGIGKGIVRYFTYHHNSEFYNSIVSALSGISNVCGPITPYKQSDMVKLREQLRIQQHQQQNGSKIFTPGIFEAIEYIDSRITIHHREFMAFPSNLDDEGVYSYGNGIANSIVSSMIIEQSVSGGDGSIGTPVTTASDLSRSLLGDNSNTFTGKLERWSSVCKKILKKFQMSNQPLTLEDLIFVDGEEDEKEPKFKKKEFHEAFHYSMIMIQEMAIVHKTIEDRLVSEIRAELLNDADRIGPIKRSHIGFTRELVSKMNTFDINHSNIGVVNRIIRNLVNLIGFDMFMKKIMSMKQFDSIRMEVDAASTIEDITRVIMESNGTNGVADICMSTFSYLVSVSNTIYAELVHLISYSGDEKIRLLATLYDGMVIPIGKMDSTAFKLELKRQQTNPITTNQPKFTRMIDLFKRCGLWNELVDNDSEAEYHKLFDEINDRTKQELDAASRELKNPLCVVVFSASNSGIYDDLQFRKFRDNIHSRSNQFLSLDMKQYIDLGITNYIKHYISTRVPPDPINQDEYSDEKVEQMKKDSEEEIKKQLDEAKRNESKVVTEVEKTAIKLELMLSKLANRLTKQKNIEDFAKLLSGDFKEDHQKYDIELKEFNVNGTRTDKEMLGFSVEWFTRFGLSKLGEKEKISSLLRGQRNSKDLDTEEKRLQTVNKDLYNEYIKRKAASEDKTIYECFSLIQDLEEREKRLGDDTLYIRVLTIEEMDAILKTGNDMIAMMIHHPKPKADAVLVPLTSINYIKVLTSCFVNTSSSNSSDISKWIHFYDASNPNEIKTSTPVEIITKLANLSIDRIIKLCKQKSVSSNDMKNVLFSKLHDVLRMGIIGKTTVICDELIGGTVNDYTANMSLFDSNSLVYEDAISPALLKDLFKAVTSSTIDEDEKSSSETSQLSSIVSAAINDQIQKDTYQSRLHEYYESFKKFVDMFDKEEDEDEEKSVVLVTPASGDESKAEEKEKEEGEEEYDIRTIVSKFNGNGLDLSSWLLEGVEDVKSDVMKLQRQMSELIFVVTRQWMKLQNKERADDPNIVWHFIESVLNINGYPFHSKIRERFNEWNTIPKSEAVIGRYDIDVNLETMIRFSQTIITCFSKNSAIGIISYMSDMKSIMYEGVASLDKKGSTPAIPLSKEIAKRMLSIQIWYATSMWNIHAPEEWMLPITYRHVDDDHIVVSNQLLYALMSLSPIRNKTTITLSRLSLVLKHIIKEANNFSAGDLGGYLKIINGLGYVVRLPHGEDYKNVFSSLLLFCIKHYDEIQRDVLSVLMVLKSDKEAELKAEEGKTDNVLVSSSSSSSSSSLADEQKKKAKLIKEKMKKKGPRSKEFARLRSKHIETTKLFYASRLL